jgi:hypothetical protein
MVPRIPSREDTLNNGHARELDYGIDVDGRPLAGERKQAPCSVTGQVVAYLSAA